MYWNRDAVEWKSSLRILGRLSDKAEEAVDFCNQRGVYFLHEWRRGHLCWQSLGTSARNSPI